MSRGKRYEEPRLNLKKVFAVILAILVIIMFVYIISRILTKDKEQVKISSKDYFVVFKDNKWGVIDNLGEIVIDPSYEEMITIPNVKTDVFLCIYDVNYETGEYKTKALNSKNEEIFTQYSQIEAISNQDVNNNIWYEENTLKVKKDGKYGIINLSGKELTECEYEEITSVVGAKNTLKIVKDGKAGIIDNQGKEIIPIQYADIDTLAKDTNKDGFIIKDENGKYGVIDFSNQKVLDAKYDKIEKVYGNDLYYVVQDGKKVLINKDGSIALEDGYDEIVQIMKNAENGVIFKKDNKYGVMNKEETKIPAEYDDLKEAKTGVLVAKQNNKYGIIDMTKTTKVEYNYTSISYNEKADLYIAEKEDFSNDIIDNTFSVRESGILLDLNDEKGYIEIKKGEETKFYNFNFEEKEISQVYTSNNLFKSKKDGKYGFVDKDGKVVVDYIYDDATEQNSCGYAGIKKDGKWGAIDNKAKVVQEPTYNLDEYLKIDFIGRWHLGKDINMNYYNQI